MEIPGDLQPTAGSSDAALGGESARAIDTVAVPANDTDRLNVVYSAVWCDGVGCVINCEHQRGLGGSANGVSTLVYTGSHTI